MDYSELDLLSPEEIEIEKHRALHPTSSARRMGVPLVAKGDSWFDFPPGLDLIDCLRRLDFSISNFSRAGDTLENMILGNSVDDDGRHLPPGLDAALLEVSRVKPAFFLFSGGGNDVAGEEFSSFLNHYSHNPAVLLRESIVAEMIDVVFKGYLRSMIERVKSAHPSTKVVMHGYGRAQPSGKATKILFIPVAGPWLLPSLQKKAIPENVGADLVAMLIDRYNSMLNSLSLEFPKNFVYIDIRDLISPADWRDELHLKNSAYARVAERISDVIK